jgi:hypothetical protein
MNNIYKEKREYTAPLIERIQLDNDISLALESPPPVGPGESMNSIPEYFNNDPFKSNIA